MHRGDLKNAKREYETIIDQIPLDVAAYTKLAQLYYNQNEFAKAEKTISNSLKIEETPIAYRLLGDIYLKKEESDKAILYYSQIKRFPEDPKTAPENAYMMALAYLISSKPENAVRIIEQTINHYPSYKPMRDLLQKVRNYYRPN